MPSGQAITLAAHTHMILRSSYEIVNLLCLENKSGKQPIINIIMKSGK